MPRRSSGGRASGPAARKPLRNPPQPAAHAPPPAPVQPRNGSARGGLGATIVDGMAWGTGMSIANRAVDAVVGPRVIHYETAASSDPGTPATPAPAPSMTNACGEPIKALQDCLNNYGSDISKCQFYMDTLQECQRNLRA
ncbi:hypothetical protein UlMin_036150 [Ulmus minor]